MTQVHHNLSWLQNSPGIVKEEIVYGTTEYLPHKPEANLNFLNLSEDVPMIVIETNQVSAETDAPMIIVANNDVSEQMICAEEEVETENDMTWYSNPPVIYEETVNTQTETVKPVKREGRLPVPYLKEPEDIPEIPLNDASYATFHPFPCDFCSRRFKKKANLMNHMVAHQTQRPHSCTICSSRFMRKCDLVNHQKIHSYVPNRENRDDISDETKYSRQQSFTRKRNFKRNKINYARKESPKINEENSPPKVQPENVNSFKPTSYVDEDVKLLLEMTNRLHESRQAEDLDRNQGKDFLVDPLAVSDTKPYVCNRCGKAFAREKALVSHSQVHADDSRYECGKCGNRFFTLELLREHSTKKHGIPCTGETSDSSDDGDSERGPYTGDVRFGTFFCMCGVSFHRLDLLKRHKRIHSKKEVVSGTFRCNSCSATFNTNEKLAVHLETNVNCQQHVCMLCGDHFSDPESIQKHIQYKHGKDLPLNACSLCGKQCKDKRALQKHFWVHADKRFCCKKLDCAKRFHSWARLRRHMLSHNTSKAVRCEECDEEFPDRRALINHRHSHFPDSHTRKFVCHECGKSFGSRSSQQIHNRIHTGERPYGCRYCWKAFADGGTLRKHERIHTGEKPYVCVVCPRAFNQRVVLREHIRSHHSGSVSKPGYSTPVYLCPVCNVVTANSDELAVHLVKHSDENTYKNRNPQTGVRTYKRRRKLHSYEYDVDNEFDDDDFFEKKIKERDSGDSDKEIQKQSPVRKSSRNSKRVDNYARFTKTFEAAMKNINSLVDSKPAVKKAKMINTKPKPNAKRGKKVTQQRGRARRGSYRSTMSDRPSPKSSSGRLSWAKDSISDNSETSTNINVSNKNSVDCDKSRTRPLRPRTKSVNYASYKSLNDSVDSGGTFKGSNNKKLMRKSTAFDKRSEEEEEEEESEKMKTEFKSEIVEEPSPEKLEEVKYEVVEDYCRPTPSADDGYVCGICNSVFPSKADLLFHVPIHI